jgi:hypothetical protein
MVQNQSATMKLAFDTYRQDMHFQNMLSAFTHLVLACRQQQGQMLINMASQAPLQHQIPLTAVAVQPQQLGSSYPGAGVPQTMSPHNAYDGPGARMRDPLLDFDDEASDVRGSIISVNFDDADFLDSGLFGDEDPRGSTGDIPSLERSSIGGSASDLKDIKCKLEPSLSDEDFGESFVEDLARQSFCNDERQSFCNDERDSLCIDDGAPWSDLLGDEPVEDAVDVKQEENMVGAPFFFKHNHTEVCNAPADKVVVEEENPVEDDSESDDDDSECECCSSDPEGSVVPVVSAPPVEVETFSNVQYPRFILPHTAAPQETAHSEKNVHMVDIPPATPSVPVRRTVGGMEFEHPSVMTATVVVSESVGNSDKPYQPRGRSKMTTTIIGVLVGLSLMSMFFMFGTGSQGVLQNKVFWMMAMSILLSIVAYLCGQNNYLQQQLFHTVPTAVVYEPLPQNDADLV